jgi:hypothetical protein
MTKLLLLVSLIRRQTLGPQCVPFLVNNSFAVCDPDPQH